MSGVRVSIPCATCGDAVDMVACEACDGLDGDCDWCAGSGIAPIIDEPIKAHDVLCDPCHRRDLAVATRDWVG